VDGPLRPTAASSRGGLAVLGGAWRCLRPIRTGIDPAPNNPGGFSFAYDGALQAVVAFGGDEGERTKSGAWVSGGDQTWVLNSLGG
jgi:hypothetical protein